MRETNNSGLFKTSNCTKYRNEVDTVTGLSGIAAFGYPSDKPELTFHYIFAGVTRTAFTTPALWFVVILIAAICILPSVAHRSFMLHVYPTYADEVSLTQYSYLFFIIKEGRCDLRSHLTLGT